MHHISHCIILQLSYVADPQKNSVDRYLGPKKPWQSNVRATQELMNTRGQDPRRWWIWHSFAICWQDGTSGHQTRLLGLSVACFRNTKIPMRKYKHCPLRNGPRDRFAIRWHHNCITCNFGHQMVPLALLQIWPPDDIRVSTMRAVFQLVNCLESGNH